MKRIQKITAIIAAVSVLSAMTIPVSAVSGSVSFSGTLPAAAAQLPAFAPPDVSDNLVVLTAPAAAVIHFTSSGAANSREHRAGSYELVIREAYGNGYRDVTPNQEKETALAILHMSGGEYAIPIEGEEPKNYSGEANGIKIYTGGWEYNTKTLTGLKPNTSYKIKVRAVSTDEGKTVKSEYSKEFTVKTPKADTKANAALAGNYISKVGDEFIQLNKDGTAAINFGEHLKGHKDTNFSYSVDTAETGNIRITLISSETVYTIEKAANSTFNLAAWSPDSSSGGSYGIDGTENRLDNALVKTTAKNAKIPLSGTFASTDYNMSAPVIVFNKDGTGVAGHSGAVEGEKDVKFTYTRKGSYLTIKFAAAPPKSLLGIKPQKGEVKARILEDVTIKKVNDGLTYGEDRFTLNNKTGYINLSGTFIGERFKAYLGRDISSNTPANVILFEEITGYGVTTHVYTTGPRG